LGLVDHQEPPVSPAPPLERLLQPWVLHVMDMHTLLIELSFIQEPKEIELTQMILFYPIFFLDISQNYKSNGMGFMNFGAILN
jgi:hypothetical protein